MLLSDCLLPGVRKLNANKIETIKAFSKIFSDWVPADISHMIKFRNDNADFGACGGPLYILAILGKEDCLHVATPSCSCHSCIKCHVSTRPQPVQLRSIVMRAHDSSLCINRSQTPPG